ncbi:helix-turn-helix transcriptional regulator [Saccharopolyspora sp. ID03-671]|uniref:helix-turn-helix transcriptional regulator n=1 Tax=Saccharopolyspora sp. ID03-671 TaxID=3073066 RepID=UPI00324FBCFE
MIDRPGLADFLRRRRALLRPADVGLPEGVRRRTPGLRRDEVAQLAGISTDYYARLEQQRGSHPSEPVVAGLARALRSTLDERDHLFHLAGLTPPPRRASGHVRPGLISLADRLTDVPVCLCTDLNEIVWQNALAVALMGDQRRPGEKHRSVVWRWFTDPEVRRGMPEEDWAHHSAAHVSDLRATYARRAGEPDITGLVEDLLARSAEFRDLWERHEVAVRHKDRKRFLHPEVGEVDVSCETLLTPDADLKLLAYFPTEGTDAKDKLDLLRVIGTQDLHPSP